MQVQRITIGASWGTVSEGVYMWTSEASSLKFS